MIAILAAAVAQLSAVSGDFDRDGRPDVAEVRVRADGGRALVIQRAAGPIHVIIATPSAIQSGFYVTTAAPGARQTACGKGAGDRGAPCRAGVTLIGDTLAFGTREASEAVALWTGREFEVVWTSD